MSRPGLSIGLPGATWLVGLKGERIDEAGTTLNELDIIGASIAQSHAVAERCLLNTKCRQSRVFELAKRPLVGISNNGDYLGSDNLIDRL
jgi:hypothetical protein